MISRRKLYAMGEPLGECVTRRVAGVMIYGGGDSASSSSSSSTVTTVNQDNRIANQGGAVVGSGATISGMVINDPQAALAAMDLSRKSTEAALVANNAAMQQARESMQAAIDSANAAAAQAAEASRQSAAASASVAQASISTNSKLAADAMAGTWAAADGLQDALIDGMNAVLSSSSDLMKMEQEAFSSVGEQIGAAYQAASDISTGNRQLVTVGMVLAGMVALMAFSKGRLAA